MDNDIYDRIKLCMSKNLAKIMISLLIMGTAITLILRAIVTPMMNSTSVSALSVMFVAMLCVSVIQFIFQYGFFVLVMQLYRQEYAVLGHLFSGFKDIKRAALVGLLFTSVYVIVLLLLSLLIGFIAGSSEANEIILEFESQFILLLSVSVLTISMMYCKFSFTWLFLFENPSMSVKEALSKSISLTRKRMLKFFVFCIRSCGYFLPFAVGLFIVFLLPITTSYLSEHLTLLSILNMVMVVCLYGSLMRLSIAFTSWYTLSIKSSSKVENNEHLESTTENSK